MQLRISGHNLDVTDALKSYVTDKLQKLERHSPHVIDVHVILKVEQKNQQIAEAQVNLRKGRVFADSASEDMYSSIDALLNKLDRQVVKHKEQMSNHDD